jgi:hypothetical protein
MRGYPSHRSGRRRACVDRRPSVRPNRALNPRTRPIGGCLPFSPKWCRLERMPGRRSRSRYNELERIADGKRVSVAWVVREAVDEYLVSQAPLFGRPTGSGR